MLGRLMETRDDLAAVVLRLGLGVVMLPHGAQKALGWFGGRGFTATTDAFVGQGIPYVLALLVIAAEFLGPLGLFVGLLTRVASFGIFCVMFVAATTVHAKHGFFMNWFGQQQGEGFEYHILAMAIAFALMIRGGGSLSLDRAIAGR